MGLEAQENKTLSGIKFMKKYTAWEAFYEENDYTGNWVKYEELNFEKPKIY